jgi:hypothetical protein
VLLAYLVASASGPAPGLAGRELAPAALPGGALFFRKYHELPGAPLAEAFGGAPEELDRASRAVGAESAGTLAWKSRVLPCVEIYWYLVPADEEFPAEARYNFDANVCYYLPLDALFGLTCSLADFLISLKGS